MHYSLFKYGSIIKVQITIETDQPHDNEVI